MSGEKFSFGSTVRYSCSGDRQLMGESLLSCQLNGHWSGPLPHCSGRGTPTHAPMLLLSVFSFAARIIFKKIQAFLISSQWTCRNMASIILDTCRWVECGLLTAIKNPGWARTYFLDIRWTNKQVYLMISKWRPAPLSFFCWLFSAPSSISVKQTWPFKWMFSWFVQPTDPEVTLVGKWKIHSSAGFFFHYSGTQKVFGSPSLSVACFIFFQTSESP